MRSVYLDIAVLGPFNRHDTYVYDKLRRTYDGSGMHDRLGKHDPHTYNQPSGCIVDTWWP